MIIIHKKCNSCGKIGHEVDMVRTEPFTTTGDVYHYYHADCWKVWPNNTKKVKMKKLTCDRCGVGVSTEIPETTIVRAWVECPECSGGD